MEWAAAVAAATGPTLLVSLKTPTSTVSIPQLVADHGVDEAVLEETLAQLLRSNRLRGTQRGREFVPAAFSRTQRACVDAFFAQNGYLEFARAQRLKVGRCLLAPLSLPLSSTTPSLAPPHAPSTPPTPPTPHQIHRPLEFVRQSFPDALSVGNNRGVVLSANLLRDLEANVEEVAVGGRSWLDVATVLPPALSAGA